MSGKSSNTPPNGTIWGVAPGQETPKGQSVVRYTSTRGYELMGGGLKEPKRISGDEAAAYVSNKKLVANNRYAMNDEEQKKVILPNQEKNNTVQTSSSPSTRNNATSNNDKIDWSKAPKPSDQEQTPGIETRQAGVNQSNRNITVGNDSKQFFDIASFFSEVLANDTLSTHSYLVTFAPFRAGFRENQPLTDFVLNKRNTLIMRCENIVLPTPSLLEEENIRRYGYGPVEKVPYGVQFSDVTMTWLVDGKSEIIDFMHQWMNTIVMHDSPNISGTGTNIGNASYRDNLNSYKPYEVGYKDAYTNPIVRVYVYNRQQQTVTEYEMYDVFPMNIQSMNLSWADENQVQKLTVTFAYTNMRMKAPIKSETQFNYVDYEGTRSPLEEKEQPDNKGGKAAADSKDSPTKEKTTKQVKASKPNATENKKPKSTGAVTPPSTPTTRTLGTIA